MPTHEEAAEQRNRWRVWLRAEFRNRVARGENPFATDEEALLFNDVFSEKEKGELADALDGRQTKRSRAKVG